MGAELRRPQRPDLVVRVRVPIEREERNVGVGPISSEQPLQVIPSGSVCAPAFLDVTVTSRGRFFFKTWIGNNSFRVVEKK